jgi:acetyltransferase
VRLAPLAQGQARGDRLSIRPYPQELEQKISLAAIGDMLVRPIRPEDAPALERMFHAISPEDVRLRFFSALNELPPRLRARLTQIDYDREMAFVALSGDGQVLGVTRLAADPDNREAEFAVLIRSDFKGKGLGWKLMQRLISYAQGRRTEILFGDILGENMTMLEMCRELGFQIGTPQESSGVVRATLQLQKVATNSARRL